jgi:hypothetical protein
MNMALLPINVTLKGELSTNPAVPNQNLKGTLWVENGNLVFSSDEDDYIYDYPIPLEHIDQLSIIEEHEYWGDMWRLIVLAFVGVSIGIITLGIAVIYFAWLLWWVYTPIEVQIVAVGWDEYNGLNATTIFILGKHHRHREDAAALIKEIWGTRGIIRQEVTRQHSLIYRSN